MFPSRGSSVKAKSPGKAGVLADKCARTKAVSEGGTLDTGSDEADRFAGGAAPVTPLLVVAYAEEGGRTGEVLLLPDGVPAVFGREESAVQDGSEAELRVALHESRSGRAVPAARFADRYISRRQILFERSGGRVRVRNLGKRPMLVRGVPATAAELFPGDAVEIRNRLVFVCTSRPESMPARAAASLGVGDADGNGLVGESAVVWALRAQIGFVAEHSGHVLVQGASGKELIAGALLRLSSRKGRRLVSRNATTFPATLIDAEVFGTAANYPNAGMPERPGLFGEAEGSTLFLDEIAELPQDLQTHLLRVLDEGGDYQRLGDARRRTANVRLVGATNRPLESLRPDLLARFRHVLHVPGLNERRDDIMLIARHLVRRAAMEDPNLAARFFDRDEPRFATSLASALVRHVYTTHVRELDALLWVALATSPGDRLSLTREVSEKIAQQSDERSGGPAREITRDVIIESLARHGGVRERVWRELGLASRFVLTRLMKKHGVDTEDRS
jgi:DNA-binding NtrC family response regulator